MYKFEWHYGIKDQKSYEQFCEDMLKEDNPYFKFPANYEQAATLIYKDDTSGYCVAIELQVPTYELMTLCEYTKEECGVWLDVYEIEDFTDMYDSDIEIESMWNKEDITFDNAEQLMLQLAKELCE